MDKAIGALRSALTRVPFLEILEVETPAEKESLSPDILVRLSLPNREKLVVVEMKTSGQPRLARAAANQLLRYRETFPDAYGIFLAPYISSQAGEICLQAGIGYLDLAGNCSLCFDGVYIERGGYPNIFSKKRDLRSLYSPKAERVLRVLLNSPGTSWRVKRLAEEAQVSLGQVSNVKKLLADREWIQVDKTGFVISEQVKLLKEWEGSYSFRRNQVLDLYSIKHPAQFEADLADYCKKRSLKYALTGFSGAARLAPAVRYPKAMAYVEVLDEAMVAELNLKEVNSGANVSLFLPYDVGVFYGASEINGTQVASPVQVYLDIVGFRGRGEEAAQALLDQVIRPKW
ncbi:MAG: type IV toxin-antitoxin system AbiEi family antitoxin [Thermodesulfobacteriota bacterium]